MTSAARSNQIVDQNNVPVQGASVYVYDQLGNLASLTSDGTTPLANPLTTDSFGNYSYQAAVNYYNEQVWFGGRRQWVENNVAVGSPGADLNLRSDLSASGGVSLVNGAAKTDFSNITGANRLLTDDNLFSPIGNGANTRGRWHTIGADSHNDIREFIFSLGADFSHGTSGTGTGGAGEKVVMYLGGYMHPGSYKGWTLNTLLNIAPGVSVEYANTVEIDINNLSGSNFGAGIGSLGMSSPSVYGLTINGANSGNNTITAAIGLISSASGPIYERGFVACSGSVRQAAFDDYSSATASFRDSGSHSYGIDLYKGTYSSAAIRLPDTFKMVSRNAGDNGDVNLIECDGTNQTVIGDTAGGNIVLSNQVLPDADTTRQIGSFARRYGAIYAQRFIHYPLNSVTPANNGEMQFELTNDTTLKIKVKGSDGTVRSTTLTLS